VIAIEPGPTKVFINWNNPDYAWSNELSPAKCPNNMSFPVDYDLLTSSNSTNGVDGDWTIACSIRGNIVTARGHLIDFDGSKWVKISFIKGGGQIDEIEIFDASNNLDDSWFFVGTSISAHTFKGMPPSENFADLVNRIFPTYNPIMIRGGIGCINSTDFVNNLPKYLQNAGNVKYWAIEMGTNDAWGGGNENVSTFKHNLQLVIDSCKARGIQPIIARVLATNPSVSNWQINNDFIKAVDDLTKENKLISGPDLYNWFLAHSEELNGGNDGVHPNSLGAESIQRLWAEKMAPLFGGCAPVEIIPYIQVNKGDLQISASKTITQKDSILLRPQINDTGTWSWIGPGGFTSKLNEAKINKIKLKQAGSYIVIFTKNDGCISTYKFEITVIKK
jgi:lysophospholipase L1-like esterase